MNIKLPKSRQRSEAYILILQQQLELHVSRSICTIQSINARMLRKQEGGPCAASEPHLTTLAVYLVRC
jgi:hypothetical protein